MADDTGRVEPGPNRRAAQRWPSAATAVVGVMGDPVEHSLSPRLHNAAFEALDLDWVSLGFPVPAGRAATAVAGACALGIRGLSVTMPHKDAAATVVDRCSPVAARTGAVNCIAFGADGIVGHNTDGSGLVAALRRGDAFDPTGRSCLVIGAGGAARSVIAALGDAGASEVVVVNRSPERAAAAAALTPVGRVGAPADVGASDLLVNATPVGMGATGRPEGQEWPIDPSLVRAGQMVVDLIYHPAETAWLRAAAGRGARTTNGLGMLVHQAAEQVAIWTGQEAPVEAMWRAVS